jgi:hypothetical protein
MTWREANSILSDAVRLFDYERFGNFKINKGRGNRATDKMTMGI